MQLHLSQQNDPTQHTRTTALRPNGAKEDAGFWRGLIGAAMRNWQRRKMIAAFDAMDDRLLRDIGINRRDIRRVVSRFDDRELGMVPIAHTGPGPVAESQHQGFRRAA